MSASTIAARPEVAALPAEKAARPEVAALSPPIPSIGRQVHYVLGERRGKPAGVKRPATIVEVNADGTVNLQVLTNSDGNKRGDDLPALLWVENVAFGTDPGTCQWPPRT
jgi:hypothetical protein